LAVIFLNKDSNNLPKEDHEILDQLIIFGIKLIETIEKS